MLSTLFQQIRRFRDDTRGNATIDMVIFTPILLIVLAATFSLHDAFRQKSLNVKAAYTIADAFSRETAPVDDAYLDGMLQLLEYLTSSAGPYSLRVSLVHYDEEDDVFLVDWSQTRGAFTALTDTEVQTKRDELPDLLNNERVIVVETETDYAPPIYFDGFSDQTFYNIGFTRPRFAPKIVWSDG